MHTYIGTRGILKEVEEFINDLKAQWTRYKMHDKELLLKVGVRPFQFWELTYPEAYHEEVMKLLMPYNQYKTETLGKAAYFLLLPFMKAIGMFKNKIKSVGKFNNYKVVHPFVDVIVFGHKHDRKDADGTEKI